MVVPGMSLLTYRSVSYVLLLIIYSMSYIMKLTLHQGSVLENNTKNDISALFSITSCSCLTSQVDLALGCAACEMFFLSDNRAE